MSHSVLFELQSFPPIDFFIKGMSVQTVWLEAQENYSKGSFRNRYHIASPNGVQRLSIPLKGGKHQQQPIREVMIDNTDSWATLHWRAIKTAYGRAPFFIHYETKIKALFEEPVDLLWEWNLRSLNLCLDLLGITLNLKNTSTFVHQTNDTINDCRNLISPKQEDSTQYPDFRYPQVFEDRHGFLPNLSILDILFCQGPQATINLQKAALKEEI